MHVCLKHMKSCIPFRIVRLNSPNLNYLVIFGSYIMNVSIFFRIMPGTGYALNAARCYVSTLHAVYNVDSFNCLLQLDTLLNTIGYCLIYGAVLAKMARIHYIFHNPTAAKKVKSFVYR